MKKLVAGLLLSVLFLSACTNSDSAEESRNYSETNSTVKETDNEEKSEASIIAKNVLKKHYKIDNFEVNFIDDTFKVYRMPDDKNSDTGKEYKNVYSAIGNFTYQDKIYDFDMLYSLTDKDSYEVLYFYTPLDDSKNTINTPLESDK
ncbi:hypothetical protein ACK4CS_14260 [Enterococcus gallinarum]|uniref:hypothetical protein n=1 Tax=Enterococcus gallinarum TaxID=1353 RepID=UPI003918D5AC